MKVAILGHTRFPIAPPFAGGLEAFTWHLTRGLTNRGVDVVLFAGPGSDPDLGAEILDVPQIELSEDARDDVAMPPEHQIAETLAYAHTLRHLGQRHDIDVVHNNSLHYLPIVLAEFLPQPVITSLHTPPHPWLEPALRMNKRTRTVAVSRWIANMWTDVTQPQVIHNGVNHDLWHQGPGGEGLVWSGRVVPEKAPHVAVHIAKAAGMKLRIAGRIMDRNYFRTHLEPLLDDDIQYIGHLIPRDLRELVASSDACLITPAWDEPYGLVAAEAMACGTPVLSIARGGLPEIVRSPGGLTIEPGFTLDEAVAKLHDVLALDRSRVRAHAELHCGIDLMLDQYIKAYEDAL